MEAEEKDQYETVNYGRAGGVLNGREHVLRALGWLQTMEQIQELEEFEGERNDG